MIDALLVPREDRWKKCPECKGERRVTITVERSLLGKIFLPTTITEECRCCHGSGRVELTEEELEQLQRIRKQARDEGFEREKKLQEQYEATFSANPTRCPKCGSSAIEHRQRETDDWMFHEPRTYEYWTCPKCHFTVYQ